MLCMRQLGCGKIMKAALVSTALFLGAIYSGLHVYAAAPATGEGTDEFLYYVALGDSIPNGYYGKAESEIVGYPVLLAMDLKKISGRRVFLVPFTKNGLTTKKLNANMLAEPSVQDQIAQADLITLTIGANDLMNEFKKVSREILGNETRFATADEALMALQDGIAENPLLLMSVASEIGGWDYAPFEEQWVLTMENITAYRGEDTQMAVTTIYNPMENRELPGTLNAVVEGVISGMNEIIQNYAQEYRYQVIDLFDSGIEEHTQSDGLHPDQTGQDMIRVLVEHELDLDAFQSEEANKEAKRQLEEAAARKAKEAEQKRQQEQRKRMLHRIEAAGLIILLISAVIIVMVRRRRRKQRIVSGAEECREEEISGNTLRK